MQLLNRSNIRIIVVFALLVIILISISDPLPRFAALSGQKLNLNKAVPYDCISVNLPEGVSVNFFENPYDAGGISNLTALYYRAQFFLAPRILHLTNLEQDTEVDVTGWFIGSNLEEQQLAQISQDYQLDLIESCGSLALFHQD
jgi:hypothetical protein